MKEQLESLNSVTINFGEGGMMIVNIILAFVMFGVALGIKPRTIKDTFKNPKSIIAYFARNNICHCTDTEPIYYPNDSIRNDTCSIMSWRKYIEFPFLTFKREYCIISFFNSSYYINGSYYHSTEFLYVGFIV